MIRCIGHAAATAPRDKRIECGKCGLTFPSKGAYANTVKHQNCCTEEDRFWRNVMFSDGCWLWTGFLNHDGYGRLGPKKGVRSGARAHKFCWEMLHGPVPAGMSVMHKCDTRACVRPDHLQVGSHQENMKDMVAKGRNCVGEATKRNFLTEHQVREILAKTTGVWGEGYKFAREYGVGVGAIHGILRGDTWAHLPRQRPPRRFKTGRRAVQSRRSSPD